MNYTDSPTAISPTTHQPHEESTFLPFFRVIFNSSDYREAVMHFNNATDNVIDVINSTITWPELDTELANTTLSDLISTFNQLQNSSLENTTAFHKIQENHLAPSLLEFDDLSNIWNLTSPSSNVYDNNETSFDVYNISSQCFNESTISTITASSRSYYSVYETILIAIITVILGLTTAFLNLMVMISFKIDKQLQTISNYFLFSLAVADLTIGTISMPLFTLYTLLGYWPLGALVCDTWLGLDYLVSNASVLNLLIISFDRYFSVTRPLTYRAKRTTRRAAFMIGSAWIISLILWPPWIYSWPYIEGQRTVPEDDCYIQFIETNEYVTVGTAIAAFYLPVTVMCGLYWRIWRETEKRQKDLTNLQAGKKDPSKRSNSRPGYPIQSDPTSFTDTAVSRSEAEECAEQDLRRQRSLSSTAMDEIETTYAPDMIIDGSKVQVKKKVRVKCCRGLALCIKRTVDKDVPTDHKQKKNVTGFHTPEFHTPGYHTPSYNAGYHTPGSVETTVPQLVSRCSSVNYIKDNSIVPNSRLRSEAMIPLIERRIGEKDLRTYSQLPCSSTLPRTESGIGFGGRSLMGGRLHTRSYSSDSVYTILIRLPNDPTPEGSNRPPSILMIEEEEAAQAASVTHRVGEIIPGKFHRGNLHLQKETANFQSGLSSHTSRLGEFSIHHEPSEHQNMFVRKPHNSEMRVPLNAKIISKQLARNSNSGGSGGSAANAANTGTAGRKKKKKSAEKKQDRKAAKTLSAILLAFIITWTPYNVLVLLKTLLSCDDCIPERLWHFAYYLCYINSTVNPMCYALCNAAFRRTYIRILTCKWHNRRKQGVQRGYYS